MSMPLLAVVSAAVLAWCFFALEVEARASPSSSSSSSFAKSSSEDAWADGDIDANDVVGRATVGRGAPRSPPGGQTYVSLAGFSRKTITGDREIGGFLVVGLPFDKLTRPSVRSALEASGGSSIGAGLTNASLAQPEPDGFVRVTPKLARASVEAAWRSAGLGNDDARLDAIVSRARWSGVLPETRLRAIRYDDQRLYAADGSSTPIRDSAGANVGLEARLTWRFDRLLYAEDEPSFERMRLERHDARARIAGHVLEALFHWHRAWLELKWAQAASRDAREPPGRPSRDEVEAQLRVLEAEATLDVLTSGWFTSTHTRAFAVRPLGGAQPASGPESL